MSTLARTPLYQSHVNLGARMVPFAGFDMPVQYTGLLEEAKAVRSHAGLFDVSHMGQFSIRGKNTLAAVQSLVTNDLSKLQLGQAQYNMLCNDQGGVIDDLIIYRRSEDETYICVNASNRRVDYDWMKSRLKNGVTLDDQSDATALIALQGPKAVAILSQICDPKTVSTLKYYWATDTKVMNLPCYLSRTGYTGEDGFELYVKNEYAPKLWENLLEIGRKDGLVPAGLGARDTLRLEMGYPLHGHELSPSITPLSAALNWVVKLQLPTPFIGQAALQREAAQGPKRLLRGYVIQDRRIARQGYPICTSDKKVVGEITSGTQSPHLNAPIALGFVESALAKEDLLYVDVRGTLIPAKRTALPFVPSRVVKN